MFFFQNTFSSSVWSTWQMSDFSFTSPPHNNYRLEHGFETAEDAVSWAGVCWALLVTRTIYSFCGAAQRTQWQGVFVQSDIQMLHNMIFFSLDLTVPAQAALFSHSLQAGWRKTEKSICAASTGVRQSLTSPSLDTEHVSHCGTKHVKTEGK